MNAKNTKKNEGKYAELPARIGSAIVLAILSIYATWAGGLTFTLLILAVSLLVFWEFRNITSASMPFFVGAATFGFLCLIVASWITGRTDTAFNLLAVGAIALVAWEMLTSKSVWGGTGLLYAALPFIALILLRDGNDGLVVILFLFACVWGADILAYFTGKTIGGPKLWPAVSPKKTWSGFIGGLVGAVVLTSLVLWYFDKQIGLTSIIVAIFLAICAQAGDLFESSIKRKFGVKDSGKIIPGHGGVLDRIDGLIFAAIAAALLAYGYNGFTIYEESLATSFVKLIS